MSTCSHRAVLLRHRVVAAVLLCVVLATTPTTVRSASRQSGRDDLAAKLDRILERPDLRETIFGVRVLELPSGRVLFRRNDRLALIPASNVKLVTTDAVLAILGDQYRFRTVIGFQGPDLVVIGGGDPGIDTSLAGGDATTVLRNWAQRLRNEGVRRIAGELLLDDSFFDHEFFHPAWPKRQLYRSYCAPIGALSINDNCVEVKVTSGTRPGSRAQIEVLPEGNTMRSRGTIATVAEKKKHVWSVDRRPGSDTLRFGGRFWTHAVPGLVSVSVDDPTRVFGGVLASVLRKEGIAFDGKIRVVRGVDGDRLSRRIEHHTPIGPVLRRMNKESQNFYAEQLFKTMGASRRGSGSWDTGREAVRHFLEVVGLSRGGVVIDDGSGLSRNNRLTAWHLTELLRVMHESPHRQTFRESLAVAGVDGTLEHRLTEDRYRGRVQAKTGTLRGVRALSGYVRTRDGRELVFSFLANNVRGRIADAQNEFCRVLIDTTAP